MALCADIQQTFGLAQSGFRNDRFFATVSPKSDVHMHFSIEIVVFLFKFHCKLFSKA